MEIVCFGLFSLVVFSVVDSFVELAKLESKLKLLDFEMSTECGSWTVIRHNN